MERKIIHLDLDAFFCAVEQIKKPDLLHLPFAVGGKPEERGVVSSCSYAARMHGIHSAMSMKKAIQQYPKLIVLPPDHSEYQKYSHLVMEYLNNISPLVEQVSIDEAFIDFSDLREHPRQIAFQIQKNILEKFNLPCSLGAASNKLVAKIANDFGKKQNRGPNPPLSITYVPPNGEAHFLAPLPVSALWGVGPKTTVKLREIGIKTIGDLAELPEKNLVAMFGKNGRELSNYSKGLDNKPVITNHTIKSISQETTFHKDITDERIIRETLRKLSEETGYRLRAEKLRCKTIKIKLRLHNFKTITRQVSLSKPTDQTEIILKTAESLLSENWDKYEPIRLIGVGVSNIASHPKQLDFWEPTSGRGERLQVAIDELQNRFGKQSIKRGKVL